MKHGALAWLGEAATDWIADPGLGVVSDGQAWEFGVQVFVFSC